MYSSVDHSGDQPNPWAERAMECDPEQILGLVHPDNQDGPQTQEDLAAITEVVTTGLHTGDIPPEVVHDYFQAIGRYGVHSDLGSEFFRQSS